jgi:hypothetical protein
MKKNLLNILFFNFCITALSIAQTRYVSPAGNDIANNCLLPGNPCASITNAVTQAIAGDTIKLSSGAYAFSTTQMINKSVVVIAADSLNKPVISSTASDMITVTSNNVTIKQLRLEMGLTSTSGLKGIVANNTYNNLKIIKNEIISIKPYVDGMVFGSYGIHASGGTVQTIVLNGNTIGPLDATKDSHGRGLRIGNNAANGPGGTITNNMISGRFPIQSSQNTSNLSIVDNIFIGEVAIGYPLNGTHIDVLNNSLDGYNDAIASSINSLLELRAINNSCSVLVEGNDFTNYKAIGLFSSASRNITVKSNTFTPLSTAVNFVSIHANSKLLTAGTQNTNYTNQIGIKGNTFNAGTAQGAAILFADHYGVTVPAFEDSMQVGGTNQADKNIFDPNHLNYIVLDTLAEPSNSLPFWAPYSITNMKPFLQNIYAPSDSNVYNINNLNLLEEKMQDSLDFPGIIGRVILNFTISVPPTQLVNGVCGNLNYVRTSAISCTVVAGATKYEWEFSDINGFYASKTSPTNYIGLHGILPILDWGTTWSVRVRAYIDDVAGVYSAPCTIGIVTDPSLTGVPITKLRNQDCGRLDYRINANNRIITNPVSGAIQYEFEFSDVTTGAVIATELRPNTVLFFNTMSPILAFPSFYNVRTRARIGSTWGNFGPVCLIQIIGLNRDGGPTAEELAYDEDGDIIVEAPYFDLTAMPNPYSDVTSIVINSSINENVYIQFYDMTGKIVEDIKVATNERFNVGANLSKGIYLLKARSDSGNQISTRLIKTN